jgi:hypothetical protein
MVSPVIGTGHNFRGAIIAFRLPARGEVRQGLAIIKPKLVARALGNARDRSPEIPFPEFGERKGSRAFDFDHGTTVASRPDEKMGSMLVGNRTKI